MVETVRGTTTRGRSEEPAGGSAPNGDTALKALARLLAQKAAHDCLAIHESKSLTSEPEGDDAPSD